MVHRRLIVLLFAVTIFLSVNAALGNCEDPFGDPNEVLEFHLHITTDEWRSLQDSTLSGLDCEGQYPYFQAGFSCGSEEPITIGVRRRRDRSETTQKLPLKLDFNQVVSGQRWPLARGSLGFRRLSLNSGQPDDAGGAESNGPGSNTGVQSALLTEHLAWRLMREELPEVSGVAYARVTLHFTDTAEIQYQGVYVLIEDIDRTAVKSRYTASEGSLYKTTDPDCMDQIVFDDGAPNDATDAYSDWLVEDPDDFSGTWYERTNEAVYLDALLRQEALRELFVNTADTILGIQNNYAALDLYGAKRMFLPWDLDDMFRPQPQIRATDTALIVACGMNNGQCTSSQAGLLTRANAEMRPRYLDVLCQMTNGVGSEEKVVAQFNSIDQVLRPILTDEVPILWEPQGQDPLDEATVGTYAAEVVRMQRWIPERIQAVRQLIVDEGVACEKGCEEGATVACDYFGCPSQRRCIDALWGPCESTQGYIPGSLDIDCDGIFEAEPGVPDADGAGGSGSAVDPATGNGGGSSNASGGGTQDPADIEMGGSVDDDLSDSGGNDQGKVEVPGATGGEGGGPRVDSTTDNDSGNKNGCGCRTATGRSTEGGAFALFLVLSWGLRRRYS